VKNRRGGDPMTERRKRILEKVREAGLDGILYAGGANFQYLSECNTYFWQRSCMNNMHGRFCSRISPECLIYMNDEGETTIVCIPGCKDSFPGNKVVLSYMDQMEDVLAGVIDGKRIGVGSDCGEWLRKTVHEIDPGIKIADAEWLLKDLRAIKDEKEIAQMRKLAAFTDEAVGHVIANLKEGMTQGETERMLMDYGIEHGIQDFSFPPTAGFKTRGTFNPDENFMFSKNSVLTEGTAIAFDVGYMDQGYCSDWGRTVYFGTAPKEVREGYEALQAGQQYMVSRIVPNETRFYQLYEYVLEETARRGYDHVLRFKNTSQLHGHLIGIEVHEFPTIDHYCDEILRPGMVFCSEPKMMFERECYMRVEDMILVTETGAEFLTNFPRELIEIK